MYWRLNEGVMLRAWRLVPYAYYIRGGGLAQKLTAEEFKLLTCCDGTQDMEMSPQLEQLNHRGLVVQVPIPKEVDSWQRARFCDNRYFPAMNWAITGQCNFNCRHCFMAADNGRLMSEFSWEQCLSLLDDCERSGVQNLTLTGGEPMLHPRFLDICSEIARRGLWLAEITTNGSFLNEEILGHLEALGLRPLLKISFDGLGHHDWMRNHHGAEQKALLAIKLCVERGFTVRVQTNVHRLNLECILPTALFLESLGVDQIRIIRTTEAPRWQENTTDACLTMAEYYDAMLAFTREYLKQPRSMDVDIWQMLQYWPRSRMYHHRPAELGCGTYRDSIPVCRGNRGMVAVTAEGEVVPCNQMSGYYAKHAMSLGNVKRDGLQKLLQHSDYLDAVTTTVGELFLDNSRCGSCGWRKICLGGCRAIALALTGDTMGSDPAKCLYFNGGYVERVDAVFGQDWNCMDDLTTHREENNVQ